MALTKVSAALITIVPLPGDNNASDYQILFTSNGSPSANPNFTWNNASQLLTVTGTATISTSAVIPIVNGGTAVSSTLTLQSTSGAGTSDAIIFKTGSQSEKMRILTGGNVGIGDSNPSQKVTIGSGNALIRGTDNFSSAGAIEYLGDTNHGIRADAGLGVTLFTYGATTGLFLQQSTGNVGIGATGPNAKLEVYTSSATNAEQIRLYNPSDAGAATQSIQFQFGSGVSSGATIKQGYDAAAYLSFTTGSTEAIRIKGGNVGIGTTSTTNQKLIVYKASPGSYTQYADGDTLVLAGSGNTGMTIVAPDANNTGVYFNSPSASAGVGAFITYNYNSSYIRYGINSGATTKAHFFDSGNVGIGTASPAQKLTVASGSVKVSKGYSYLFDDVNDEIRVDDSPAWLAVANTMTLKTYSGAFVFQNSNGAASIMTVRADTGNVGIGTTSPGVKLEVAGTVYSNIGNFIANRANAGANTSGSGVELRIDGTTYAAIRQPAAEVLAFYRGSGGTTETMRIDNGGNVGIGTTNPNTRLQVNQDVSNTDGTGFDQGQLMLSDASLDTSGLILGYRYHSGVAEYARIQARNSGGATNIAMQAGGGNVGIGTANPSSNLEVYGSTPVVKITQNPGVAGSSLLNIQAAGGAGNTGAISLLASYIYADTASGGLLNFGADRLTANAKMVINTSSGLVGIGTVTPVYNLHVAGTSASPALSSASGIMAIRGTATGMLTIGQYGSGDYGMWLQTKDSSNSGAAYSIALNPLGGNVGIGTTSPAVTLQVGSGSRSWDGGSVDTARIYGTTGRSMLSLVTTDAQAVNNGASISLGGAYKTTGASEFAMIKGAKENSTDNNSAGYMALYTGSSGVAPSERMRIDSSGRVGIGTTSPATSPGAVLHINGTTAHTVYETGNLTISSGSLLKRLALGVDSSGTMFSWIQSVETGTLTRALALQPIAGNVGIGTTVPTQRLAVVNAGTSGQLDYVLSVRKSTVGDSNSSAVGILLGAESGDFGKGAIAFERMAGGYGVGTLHFLNRNSIDSVLPTLSDSKMAISKDGDVGIGTSSNAGNTLRYLDVQNTDTGSSAGAIIRLITSNSAGNAVTSLDMVKYKNGYFTINNNDTSGQIAFGIGGSERMRIESTGNLKVGGSADRSSTVGTNQIVIYNGTAPVGTLANGCSFFSTAGEMRVMDAAGNWTQISPHDRKTNEWIYNSVHTPSGKGLKINVEKLLRFINDHFGLDCVHDLIEEV